jgi:GNAT superfamily N-acetyltransferase
MKSFKEYFDTSFEIKITKTNTKVGTTKETFTLLKNGKEAGHIKTSIHPNVIWLAALYISPEFRNQGLAKKLIQVIIDYYHKPINLRVGAYEDEPLKDDQLIAFYKKLGFKQIPNMNKYYLRYE